MKITGDVNVLKEETNLFFLGETYSRRQKLFVYIFIFCLHFNSTKYFQIFQRFRPGLLKLWVATPNEVA